MNATDRDLVERWRAEVAAAGHDVRAALIGIGIGAELDAVARAGTSARSDERKEHLRRAWRAVSDARARLTVVLADAGRLVDGWS